MWKGFDKGKKVERCDLEIHPKIHRIRLEEARLVSYFYGRIYKRDVHVFDSADTLWYMSSFII